MFLLRVIFHTAELQSVNEIFLQKRIDDQDRQRCHNRNGRPDRHRRNQVARGPRVRAVRDGCAAVRVHRRGQQLHQLVLKRAQILLGGGEQKRIEPGVPLSDRDEQRNGGQYRLAQRQDDREKIRKSPAPSTLADSIRPSGSVCMYVRMTIMLKALISPGTTYTRK